MAILIGLGYATPGVGANPPGRETRQAADAALEGHTLIVRIYPDAANDPRHFEKVRVRITNLRLGSQNVKAAYPSISGAACVAVLGADQTDEAIATIVGPRVCTSPYHDKVLIDLAAPPEIPEYHPLWTFFDARGEPMPHASVEIGYVVNHPAEILWLATVRLDEQGQLARLGPSGAFAFRVSHPDYGIALLHNRGLEMEPSGIYVVPLVPRNSPAVDSAIQGTVQDTEGRPVPEAKIDGSPLPDPNGRVLELGNQYICRALTDEQGKFSLCIPFVTKDLVLEGLPAPQSRYRIHISPPKPLNLRQLGLREETITVAGVPATFTLTALEASEAFHTFSFEYYEGPVTDTEELSRLKLFLFRDGPWGHLSYVQIKNGYALPTGTLRAGTQRWGRDFAFAPIELTPDSPEHLTIRAGDPILYQGQVVDGVTDLPVAGAIVSVGMRYSSEDPCSVTTEQWQSLRECVVQTANDDAPDTLYRLRDRAVMTNADGVFTMLFLPGFEPHIAGFCVDKPGYLRQSVTVPTPSNGSDLIAIDTIRLTGAETLDYAPTFVFQDETGAALDPKDFTYTYLGVRRLDGQGFGGAMGPILERRPFTPGLYNLEAIGHRKRYLFEPVDLTVDQPQVAIFVPQRVEPAEIVYQGQVIDGTTGLPIPKALVMQALLGTKCDASGLEPAQWSAIAAVGPHPDPNDPALAPLLNQLELMERGPHRWVLTDADGWYHLALELKSPNVRHVLLAMAQDHLGAYQHLAPAMRNADNTEFLKPDEDGFVTLPPLKLFPAGTLTVHPVVPDLGTRFAKPRIRLQWRVAEEDPPWWVDDLYASPRDNNWASTFYRLELEPNRDQTLYVPAGLDLRLILYQLGDNRLPPTPLGTVRLRQGQVAALGRVEFDEGVKVLVNVVNERGNPLVELPIACIDANKMSRFMPTNAAGQAIFRVLSHSSGRFCAVYIDRQTQERFEEGVPFEVGGDEDTGRQFTLELSQEMIDLLSQLSR